jgi:hypothetical protein
VDRLAVTASARRHLSGEQGQGADVPRTHDTEVPPIERGHLGGPHPLRKSHHGGIGGTQRKIGVSLDKIGHPIKIRRGQVGEG